MWSRGLVVWFAGSGVALGCGETRALELFPKKEPAPPMMPAPAMACGDLAMCPPDRNLCVDEQCVQCAEDMQCMAGKGVCLAGQCVECRADEQCPKEKVCHPEAGHCTEPCGDATQCKDKNRAVCDVARGICVRCTTDAECDEKHVCDPRSNECVGCLGDGNCPDGGICDPGRRECMK